MSMRLILEEVGPVLNAHYEQSDLSLESLIQVLTDVVEERFHGRRNKPDSHTVVMAFLRSKSENVS